MNITLPQFLTGAAGAILIYSAVKKVSPVEVIKSALKGGVAVAPDETGKVKGSLDGKDSGTGFSGEGSFGTDSGGGFSGEGTFVVAHTGGTVTKTMTTSPVYRIPFGYKVASI